MISLTIFCLDTIVPLSDAGERLEQTSSRMALTVNTEKPVDGRLFRYLFSLECFF